MTEIPKKPEKKDFEYFANSPYCKECEDHTRCQQCGFWMDYNQAIDDYEKYHNYEMSIIDEILLKSTKLIAKLRQQMEDV